MSLSDFARPALWQVHEFDFINVDDFTFITNNQYVPLGITLNGLHWAFTTTYAGFWHPLTWLSFMLNYQLYGLNASGYHITNLIFHILSALLLFLLFDRMTKETWKSAFIAAFFALHSHHVESVAWIAERKDVLSAFFWMLTLCLYVYYAEKPTIKRYLLVLFCFTCGLMSKSMIVTLPVIMIFLDYWPLNRFNSKTNNWIFRQLKEKTPFFILSAVFSIATLFIWHHPSSVQGFPIASRIANAPVVFITYLGKILWPHNMHFFHYFSVNLPMWQAWGAILLVTFTSVAVIIMAKRIPYLFAGWFWYAITILPVLGLMPYGITWMHDHYTYLPSIGIGTMLAWGAPSLIQKSELRKKVLFPLGLAILITLAIFTWYQCGYWKDSITLFSHDLEITKHNSMAHNFLGYSLYNKGKTRKALYHYNKAIQISPYYAPTYNNRGNAYGNLGQYKRAIDDYTKAINLKTDSAEFFLNRGTMYGKIFGQYKLALNDLNEAIRLNNDYADAYNNRGIIFDKLGFYQEAIDDFNKAIGLKPNYANAWNNLAFSYLNFGKIELGCTTANKACRLGNCNALENVKKRGLCN